MPINGVQASAGKKPATPTIGTATDGGTGTTVSVAFTPSSYIGKGTITYTATSNPGSITATGSGSPITVSSLTAGTAYTFTVKGDTNYGVASDNSAASNSVTPTIPTNFDSIATYTGNGSNITATFSSIPSTYKALQIRFTGLGAAGNLQLRFNGDTGNNYTFHSVRGNGSTVSSSNSVGNSFIGFSMAFAQAMNTTYPLVSVVDIVDYASTSKNKVSRGFVGVDTNATNSQQIELCSGVWLNTSAINSLTVTSTSGNFATGTRITLYGVK